MIKSVLVSSSVCRWEQEPFSFFCRRISLCAVFLITFVIAPLSFPAAIETEGVFLPAEKFRFHEGDNPAWASRDHDDLSWQQIKVPESWLSLNIAPKDKTGWYKVRFHSESLAVLTTPAVYPASGEKT